MQKWSTKEAGEKIKGVLDNLSSCSQAVEYIHYLLAGRDLGRMMSRAFPSNAEEKSVASDSLLSESNLQSSLLGVFETSQYCIAELGAVTPGGDEYVSDHVFIVVRHGSHFALYQAQA